MYGGGTDNIYTKNIDEIKLIVYELHKFMTAIVMWAMLQNGKSGKQNNKGKSWSNTAVGCTPKSPKQ